ncbi:MAG: hypothetical protein H6Q61_1008 [Firmicutes bacterium]|nr:hypothetical protein [Bacillota bacterium]
MKKHTLLISCLIIILSISLGFAGVVYKDTRAYQDLAEKHLENTLSLANTNISKDIMESMTRPVMVSKTMANDEFLKDWLLEEDENIGNDAYLSQLITYLSAYQQKYDYSTVFCVAAQTGVYYYQDGFNKRLSSEDEHDIWYYNFLASGQEFDLQIDTNETSKDSLTVFVNFRVEGNDGTLLGVIGVGLQIDLLEEFVRSYEEDYDLSVYIINAGGAENSFAGSTDVFISEEELQERTGIHEQIELISSAEPTMRWYTDRNEWKCLITQYNETLGWYMVLEKETGSISSAFHARIMSNIFSMIITLAICIMVATAVFINCNQRIVTMENTDELTGLSNRKLFTKQYTTFVRKHRDITKSLFMFDIDNFKSINDAHGHLFGNQILAMVGEELHHAIDGHGIAARWGGDEFLGVLAVAPEDARQIMEQFKSALTEKGIDENCRVTVSVGITEVNSRLNVEQVIQKADEAMYYSKKNGRDQIFVS